MAIERARRPVHPHRQGRPHRGARRRRPTSSTSRPAARRPRKQVRSGLLAAAHPDRRHPAARRLRRPRPGRARRAGLCPRHRRAAGRAGVRCAPQAGESAALAEQALDGPEPPRRQLRRPGQPYRLLGRAAVHRPVRAATTTTWPGSGNGASIGEDEGAEWIIEPSAEPQIAGVRPGRLGLRHRQRRLGQDQDPGRPGGAPAAAPAPTRRPSSASPTPRRRRPRCSGGCSSGWATGR